jgi:uncharacterized membrane protein
MSFVLQNASKENTAFYLLLGATILSGIVSLAGVGLLLSHQESEGTVTTIGGLVSNLAFAKLAKDANDRLDQAMREAREDNDEEENDEKDFPS